MILATLYARYDSIYLAHWLYPWSISMSTNKKTVLGEILVEDMIISRDQLNMALRLIEPARLSGKELVKIVVISPCDLYIALESLLADTLMELGYTDERDIFFMYSNRKSTPKPIIDYL